MVSEIERKFERIFCLNLFNKGIPKFWKQIIPIVQ